MNAMTTISPVSRRSARSLNSSFALFRLAGAFVLAFFMALLPCRAALMVYEGFNYPVAANSLTGQTGGYGWSGGWTTVGGASATVQAGNLTAGAKSPAGYDNASIGNNSCFVSNGSRAGRNLDTSATGLLALKGYTNASGNVGASGKILYLSFIQKPSITNNNFYELEFHKANLSDPGRIGGVGCDTASSTSVYLRCPAAAQTLIGPAGPAGTAVNFYVVRIDYLSGNDTVRVYQNPTSATEPGTPTLTRTGCGDMSFNGISLAAFVNGVTVQHDEIRLGETWKDVTVSSINWAGDGAANNWDTSSTNWTQGGLATNYQDNLFVNFNDSGSNSPAINLTTNFRPISISFSNSTKDYVIGGTGSINASANISKVNAGNTTLAVNTTNGGNTYIVGGTMTVSNVAWKCAGAGANFFGIGYGGTGALTINGSSAAVNTTNITYAGGFQVGAYDGTTVGNGTLNMNGGTLQVAAFTVALNGSTGTVVQNGGAITANSFTSLGLGSTPATGSATYQMNGGTFTAVADFTVNESRNSDCTFNQTNGTVTLNGTANANYIGRVGAGGGKGIYNLSGGALTVNGSDLQIGGAQFAGATGVLNLSGTGQVNINGVFALAVARGSASTGTVNQTNGTVTISTNSSNGLWFGGGGGSAVGTYNLVGGTLALGHITAGTPATSKLNFSGGTLKALTNFTVGVVSGFSTPVNTGGANFDVAGRTVIWQTPLVAGTGAGGLSVTDSVSGGILELAAASGYTGDTVVNAGTLRLDVASASIGALRLASGAALNLTNSAATNTFSACYTNGVLLASGSYKSNTLAFITGPGTLTVSSVSAGIWDGGGADNNWSTGVNWDNDVTPVFPIGLTFAGSTRLVNTNDLTGVKVYSLTFDSAAGAFTLGGNAITNTGNLVFNGNPAAPVTQTVNLNQTLVGNVTIDTPTNGNVILGGNLTSVNDVYKIDAGTLTLGGTNAIETLDVNGGTNIITGSTTITGVGGGGNFNKTLVGDGATVPNCKGTLVIQPGAALSIVGSFADNMVLGRDSGSGTVIQNGGTFNYNNNQNYFFVAATVNANTRSEYDMNGGLFNLNGKTLVVGYGNSVLITGVVNQASGVITNVGNLLMGFTSGYGSYTLGGGSIYIGAGGITSSSGLNTINLGGGTVGAYANWSSSLKMNLTNLNGSVTFSAGTNNITLSGVLSGSGGLTNNGTGTLLLSATNTYAGNTVINAGTLQLNVSSTLAGALSLASGAVLNLPTFATINQVADCYTNNVALAHGFYTSASLPGIITGSGVLKVGNFTPSTGIWYGAGVDNNWSTGTNWDNDMVPVFPIALTFVGPGQLSNNNNLTGITANGLTFDTNAGAFVLAGNAITNSGSLGFNGNPAAPITQTVNLNMTLTANATIDTPANGNLALGGNLNGTITLTKTDNGTLALGGTNSIAGLSVNGGTNVITGSTAIAGTGSTLLYLGNANTNFNGTLILQPGSALAVTGNFGDSFVVGRDGGSGTLTQNGGTFSYNPGNRTALYVGAANNTNTHAAYNMNGGLWDMTGKTIFVGTGNTVFIQAGLNQSGGMITNVGTLDLGVLLGYGSYTLSGGSIYLEAAGMLSGSGLYKVNLGGGTVGAQTNWSSSLNLNLTNLNGSVTFNPGTNTITLSGVLSGNGGLTNSGPGTLILAGVNSYTGDTTVAGGTLQLNLTGSSVGAFHVAGGAVLNLNYTGNYVVAGCDTNGVALPVGTYNAGNLPGIIIGSGNLVVASSISTGIWYGYGANNNWSTATNWDQNAVPIFPIALTFAGPGELSNNNDLTGITASSVTFDVAAGAFTLGGNDLTVGSAIGFNGNPAAPINQTVNLNLAFGTNVTINTPTNGNVILNGTITTTHDLYKLGAGTLTLGGIDYVGTLDVNGGTAVITNFTLIGGVTGAGYDRAYVGDGDAVAHCNGTLILQTGGVIEVYGNFADNFVIGRDGGSGTLIQNDGTFLFTPNNHKIIYVGAANTSGTTAVYDMNGGVLDLTGGLLDLALSISSAPITGTVNQSGGSITNVGGLMLGINSVAGLGVYNLTGGSIYIGTNGITSSGSYAVNLGGGTVGAGGSWASSLGMTLTGTNGDTTFDTAGNTITLSGALVGSGGLVVIGGGTLDLTGFSSSYAGNSTANGGKLELGQATLVTNSTVIVTNGGTLQLDYSGVTNIVAGLLVNGISQGPGVYNSTTAPTYITGTGSLQVPSPAAPLSTNSYLMTLVFSPSAGFAPAFTSNVLTGYNETNAYGDTPTVTVTNADATATNTLIVNGVSLGILTNETASVPLTFGVGSTNVVQVQVVSQDLSVTNLYVVDVTLLPPPLSTNAQLTSLALTPAGTLYPTFDTGTTSYTATNTCANNPLTVTVTNADVTATNTLYLNGVSQGMLTNGVASALLTLVTGANTVTVQVVSQDLTVTNNYVTAATLTAPPTVSVNSVTNCGAVATLLTATSSASSPSYLWSDSETTASITVTPGSTTIYTVTVTDGTTGCANSGSGTITVNPVPTVTVNSTNIYAGGSATLAATTSASSPSYLWSPGGLTTASITVSPSTNTTYTVTVTDGTTGCANSGSGTVTILPSTNALLASLSITPAGTLAPTFASGTTSYNATNVFTNNPVTVAAGSADANATLALSYNGGGYGSAVTNSLSISGNTLVLPANTVAVRVVSQDLSQTNVYTVNVLLQPSATVPKLTNSVSGSTLTLTWPADHLGYRLLVQTNNLNKGVSGNISDWGTVPGTATITTTNITIIKAGVTNQYYKLVYP